MATSSVSFNHNTLFIANIPYKWTNNNFEDFFSEIGPIKRCFVVSKKDSKNNKGFGYVTFVDKDDAEKAKENVKIVEGRHIRIKYADKRVPKKNKNNIKPEEETTSKGSDSEKISKVRRKKTKTLQRETNPIGSLKKPRLIIRNISFKCTEDDLKAAFSEYGEIKEVVIPLRADKKMFGFGFVEFVTMEDANKAMENLNTTPILGRPIVVDWAIPKEKYQKAEGIKNIPNKPDNIDSTKKQTSPKNSKIKFEESEDDDNVDESEDDNVDESEDDNVDESEDEEHHEEMTKKKKYNNDNIKKSKQQKKSQDPDEIHRTLFLRNLSFDTEDADLKEHFSKFGDLKYGLICRNPESGLSKGTGFIQFKDKESADRCLGKNINEQEGDFVIKGRRVIILPSLNKDECQQKATDKVKKKKDNRNLYLAREGFIRQNTQAAEGVSKSDMMKRVQLQTSKFNKLKNLNFFISPTRLCILNIPLTFDDHQLKQLCYQSVEDKSSKITEARIMRNLKTADAKSKGFGYVEFSNHEHAIHCLRKLNNNPDIFSKDQRPIVEFSIENRVALNVKMKRQENSLLKQGMSKKNVSDNKKQQLKSSLGRQPSEVSHMKPFPSNFGPKFRHKQRNQPKIEKKTHGDKLSRKQQKKQKNINQEMNVVSQKRKSFKMEDKNFNQLVHKYRDKLMEKDSLKRSKWFKE